jgi:choline dehydrogenase-like flavoprotein
MSLTWTHFCSYRGPNTPDEMIPFFAGHMQNTTYDWNFTLTNQPGLGGRSLVYHRGRGLGGSTLLRRCIRVALCDS